MADPANVGQTLDEDDDFVEFEQDNWSREEANFNTRDLWDAAWFDKEDTEDAVAQQIRTELQRKAAASSAGQQAGGAKPQS